jgi:hypothetical protein
MNSTTKQFALLANSYTFEMNLYLGLRALFTHIWETWNSKSRIEASKSSTLFLKLNLDAGSITWHNLSSFWNFANETVAWVQKTLDSKLTSRIWINARTCACNSSRRLGPIGKRPVRYWVVWMNSVAAACINPSLISQRSQ